MLILYKILLNTAYFFLWPYFIIKRLKARDEWNQRLCLDPGSIFRPEAGKEPRLWLHASSVGEVRVLDRLVRSLKKAGPEIRIFISTYTRTGQQLARNLFSDVDAVFYFPLDCHFPLRRLFDHFRPDGVVMVETEIWPYFLSFCERFKVSLILANGRLSEKSTRRYKLFYRSLARLFLAYRRFIMQTEADAGRIISIGAKAAEVTVLGNIKHDPIDNTDRKAKRSEVRKELLIENSKMFLIAASTRPGEEEVVCQAIKSLDNYAGKIIVMIAPRHLERLDEVERIIRKAGFDFIRYSALKAEHKTAPVILMDRMGVLSKLFYGADLAFVGGTIADLGGHNIMEPVLAGVPVMFGPSVYNVTDAAENILTNRHGVKIFNAADMAAAINQFAAGNIRFEKPNEKTPSVADRTVDMIIEEFGL